ncbi:MAG TPA: carboxypeptidase-like regulatory domain-containing protein [Pyrinomonadaceae bacterium]|nr:carboxypeptidase-like regulatory domain-containing protein [Pyrinomonadaceae bacterium]
MKVIFISVAFLSLLISPRLALACSCGGSPSICGSFAAAEAVFVGTITRVEQKRVKVPDAPDAFNAQQIAYVQVDEAFKGAKESELIFRSYGSSCDATYIASQRWLFYAHFNKDKNEWELRDCDRSTLIEWAADDLIYLRNLAASAQTTRVSGVLRGDSNKPLMGMKVKVSDGHQVYETFTDKLGVYEISGLPPGKYTIQPETPSTLKVRYSRPSGELDLTSREVRRYVLKEKSCAGENFYFSENTSISGKLFDPDGRPLKEVCVRLLPKTQLDTVPVLEDCTKEDGSFKIDEIPLADYVLVANEDGKITSFTPFPTVYYPGVFDKEKATVLTLASGDQRENVDIRVPSLQQTRTIEGQLLYADGRPVADESVEFTEEPERGQESEVADTQTDSNGRFSLVILDGLKGRLSGYILTRRGGQYRDCPKIEKFIKTQDDTIFELHTNVIKLDINMDYRDVELKFPFPYCAKVKSPQ